MTVPKTVLLVLDDTTVAHAFARILEMQGYLPTIADSFIEALEIGPADCLVVDSVVHRDGNTLRGRELIEAMRAFGYDPQSILIESPEVDDPFLDVDTLLLRPVMPDRLIEAIELPREDDDVQPSPFGEELSLSVEAHPDAAESAARELIAWCLRCDVAPSTRARIGSAVAEIVENAAYYGACSIELEARMTSRTLRVTVTDDGAGFDAVAALTDTSLSARTGLGRVHSLADSVEVQSSPEDGTRITLEFRVSSVEFEDEFAIDLSELDFFVPATSKELLSTLAEDPKAPIVLSPALAVVVGRLLMGPDQVSVLEGALRA